MDDGTEILLFHILGLSATLKLYRHAMTMQKSILQTKHKCLHIFWLLLVLSLAVILRLHNLGGPAFRADTMLFPGVCRQPISAWTLFVDWLQVLGNTAQFPFSMAFTKFCIDFFHLPPSAFFIRLPNAIFGILTVVAMYMLGRQLAGRRCGLFLALLLAVNPFHIQLSCEAYFYSAMLLGVTLQTWGALLVWRRRSSPRRFSWRFFTLMAVGFFLMTYSHVSGWWVGAPITVFIGWILGRRAYRNRNTLPDFLGWLAPLLVIGTPLLFFDWGVPFFLTNSLSADTKTQTQLIFGGEHKSFFIFLQQLVRSAAWGATAVRSLFLYLAGLLGLLGLLIRPRRARRGWIILALLTTGLGIYYLSFLAAGSFDYGQRHVAFALPLYVAFLGYGIWRISSLPCWRRAFKNPVWRRVTVYALVVAAIMLNIYPAWIATKLTGKPTPYKDIQRWCNTELPPGTLVLADRWFEPWNELQLYSSTNVSFTFTIPNEPPNVYTGQNWRATVQAFFAKYPDSGYLYFGNYDGRPEIGPWSWPAEYFKRRHVFTNHAAMTLRNLGLAYREDFYEPFTNRVVISLFYDTREDALMKARESGREIALFYGAGWGYEKLWRQLNDFRDWRVLTDRAVLDVYSLTEQKRSARLVVRGMAINGGKRAMGPGGVYHDFRHLQLEEWALPPLELQPGLNQIVLHDPLWRSTHIPLLVDDVRVILE